MKNLPQQQKHFPQKRSEVFTITILFLFLLLLFFAPGTKAQYYYKDIWSNAQTMKEFSILKSEKLKIVKVKSFEDDGEPSEGFFCEKKINKNYTQSQMISKAYITGQSLLVSDYDTEGRLLKITDNTPTTTSITQYDYNTDGRLTKVQTVSKADDDSGEITETHEYFYSGVQPDKMICKKNNVIVSTVNFIKDSLGNIIEEDPQQNSRAKKYYYYYNNKNQLTDVVHYNEVAARLLPDYMFEYNSLNQPRQMISTEEGTSNYYIWKYTYNDKKLRETEKCLSKERRVLGTIEYQYQ